MCGCESGTTLPPSPSPQGAASVRYDTAASHLHICIIGVVQLILHLTNERTRDIAGTQGHARVDGVQELRRVDGGRVHPAQGILVAVVVHKAP